MFTSKCTFSSLVADAPLLYVLPLVYLSFPLPSEGLLACMIGLAACRQEEHRAYT